MLKETPENINPLSELTEDEIARFRASFNLFDEDKDGCLEREEIRHCLNMFNQEATDDVLDEYFVQYDKNSNGKIEFNDFCFLIKNIAEKNQKEKKKKVPKIVDLKTYRNTNSQEEDSSESQNRIDEVNIMRTKFSRQLTSVVLFAVFCLVFVFCPFCVVCLPCLTFIALIPCFLNWFSVFPSGAERLPLIDKTVIYE